MNNQNRFEAFMGYCFERYFCLLKQKYLSTAVGRKFKKKPCG